MNRTMERVTNVILVSFRLVSKYVTTNLHERITHNTTSHCAERIFTLFDSALAIWSLERHLYQGEILLLACTSTLVVLARQLSVYVFTVVVFAAIFAVHI